MAVCYDKLFHRMIDKRITNAQLMSMAGFSPNIITRLKRNEYISLESIEKICKAINCSVDDILEFDPAVPMNAEIILHYQQVNTIQIY